MSRSRRMSIYDDIDDINAHNEATFEEFFQRFRNTVDRFNLDNSFSFSEELESVISNSTSNMADPEGSQDLENNPGNVVEGNDRGPTDRVENEDGRNEELLSRIERSMVQNQIRIFQQMDVFMGNVLQKLEDLRLPSQQVINPPQVERQSSTITRAVPPRSSSASTTFSASGPCRLDRWNIKYDGSDNVSDFLLKIGRMQSSSSYCDQQIAANFHILLDGRPNKWFWRFVKKNPDADLSSIKEAMKKEFGKMEWEIDIYMKLMCRKQGSKEAFDDFYVSVSSLNDRLKEPFNDKKLIEIIRGNTKEKLGEILLSAEVKILEQLRQKACEAERFLNKRAVGHRSVSEIAVENDSSNVELEKHEVAAMYSSRKPVSTANYICWNCDQKGHAYHFCPSAIRNLFCFLCGAKGVNTVQCGKHQAGNFPRDETRSGEVRSSRNPTNHSQN